MERDLDTVSLLLSGHVGVFDQVLTRIRKFLPGLDITNSKAMMRKVFGIKVVDHIRTTVVVEALQLFSSTLDISEIR